MVPKAVTAVAALYYSYKFKALQTNWLVHVCSAQIAALPQAGTGVVSSNTLDFLGSEGKDKGVHLSNRIVCYAYCG